MLTNKQECYLCGCLQASGGVHTWKQVNSALVSGSESFVD